MARRSPAQNLFLVCVVIAGIWLTALLLKHLQQTGSRDLERELPDFTIEHATPERLYGEFAAATGRSGFKPRGTGSEPKTWTDISLRLYARDGEYLKLLACTIDAAEVETSNPSLFAAAGRRRSRDDLPPAWWPWERDRAGSPWRVCPWWQPGPDGIGAYHFALQGGFWIGEYLHYDPASRRLHLWETKRRQVSPPTVEGLTADLLAASIAAALKRSEHPLDRHGWFDAPGLTPDDLGFPANRLPAGLHRLDARVFPWRGPGEAGRRDRYLLRLHGLDEAAAASLCQDLDMRPLPDDAPPPWQTWAFAAPEGGAPAWFAPGPGPRRAYVLRRPGSGRCDRGRWAAYDRAQGCLCLWDWAWGEPQAPEADLTVVPARDLPQTGPTLSD